MKISSSLSPLFAWRISHFAFLLLLTACTEPTPPRDPPTINSSIPHTPSLAAELNYIPLNDPEKLNRAEFSLFIPASITAGNPIRCIIALSANTPFYANPQWRTLADRQHVVLLKFRTDAPPPASTAPASPIPAPTAPALPTAAEIYAATSDTNTPAATGDALRSITRAIQQYFTPQSHHPELDEAPFLFVGQAESSLQVCTFADMIPDHTAGSISLHTPFPPQLTRLAAGPGTRTPQLLSVPPANAAPAFAYFSTARKSSGTVTLLLESSPATTDAFALAWTESIIRLRLPLKPIPGRGSQLNPAPEDLYAGNFSTHKATPFSEFKGDRATAVWLPDEDTAKLWSAAMTPK